MQNRHSSVHARIWQWHDTICRAQWPSISAWLTGARSVQQVTAVLQEEQAKQEAETKKAAEDSEEEDDEGRVYLAERIADFFDRPALASIKPYVQVTCSASCCLGAL